jgi:superfamily II DNA/RNA helicase
MKDQLDFISRGIDIIVATPGRLIDFLNRGAIKLNDL